MSFAYHAVLKDTSITWGVAFITELDVHVFFLLPAYFNGCSFCGLEAIAAMALSVSDQISRRSPGLQAVLISQGTISNELAMDNFLKLHKFKVLKDWGKFPGLSTPCEWFSQIPGYSRASRTSNSSTEKVFVKLASSKACMHKAKSTLQMELLHTHLRDIRRIWGSFNTVLPFSIKTKLNSNVCICVATKQQNHVGPRAHKNSIICSEWWTSPALICRQ